MEWFFLDPDNRRNPPTNYNADGSFKSYDPHCCRCNKPILQENDGFRSVTVHPVNPWVRNNPLGKDLIGLSCWKEVQKNPIEEANK